MPKKIVSIFSLLIILMTAPLAFGQKCKSSSGKEGYCGLKHECYISEGSSDCGQGLYCCTNKGKAKQKCEEYGKYVYKEDYSVALSAKNKVHNLSECVIEAVPLIVGGVKVKEKEFPHLAAIGYGEELKEAIWLCSGSLISENFILTAAHCSESPERGPAKFARLGVLNIKNFGDSAVQDFTITERINHPKYKLPSRYHDIALFKLSNVVKVSGYIRPACLHLTPDEFQFKKATAAGWGKLNYSDNEGSSELMKVVLSFIDYPKCNTSFSADSGGKSLPQGIISSQFCAGEMSGGKDTCQGDSGGPMQVIPGTPYCMYSILGITSFGKFCGFKNSPAVYTKVSHYVSWIESVVWP